MCDISKQTPSHTVHILPRFLSLLQLLPLPPSPRPSPPQELKKPLRVTFLSDDGRLAEEGVDQGGVSREFFQLLVGQLFSPDYGMFLEVDESHVNWFNTASLESLVRLNFAPGERGGGQEGARHTAGPC